MTEAPAASSSWGVTPLTAPSVPTGMKAGVSTTPWGVVSRPNRAAPSVAKISKVRGMEPRSRLRLRGALAGEIDRLLLDPRRELHHEAVLGDGRVALEVAELVLDRVAVRLLVLEAGGEEGLAVDPQRHRLQPLGDALIFGHQLQAIEIALLLGQLETHREVLQKRLQAAARPEV